MSTTTTQVRERSIQFTPEMVRAILDGRKRMTRRRVKPQPPAHVQRLIRQNDGAFVEATPGDMPVTGEFSVTPPWRVGDRLWVKERWGSFPRTVVTNDRKWWPDEPHYWGGIPDDRPQLVDERNRLRSIIWAADGETDPPTLNTPRWWSNLLFMPRWACRLVLEVTGVRVERAHQISDGDVKAEGVDPAQIDKWRQWLDPRDVHGMAFGELWDSINGKGSWKTNPWVWCVSFRRVEESR